MLTVAALVSMDRALVKRHWSKRAAQLPVYPMFWLAA